MKFKTYLNEGRSISISKERAIDEIGNNCVKNFRFFLKKKEWLYRGVEIYKDFLFVDSNKGKERKSANIHTNYYTLLIDNLPSWKNYPLRSRSIICSTDERYAKSYGTPYVVIPYDNTNIAIAPEDDLWDSFPKLFKLGSLGQFNDYLEHLFIKYDLDVFNNDYGSLKDALIQINSFGYKDRYDIFDSKDVMKTLDKLMSPDYNGFKLGLKNMSFGKEVWIQGKSILINNNIFWDIIDEI
jgi:hypothetical protein